MIIHSTRLERLRSHSKNHNKRQKGLGPCYHAKNFSHLPWQWLFVLQTAAGCSSSSSSTSSQGASTGGSSTGGTSSGASTGGSSTGGTSSDSSENPYAEEITIEILKRSDAPTEYVNTLHDDMLKEKFNMVWKESYVSGSDMATKLFYTLCFRYGA